MKMLSRLCGALGVLLAAWAAYGRFHGPPTLSAFNDTFAASSALTAANTLLLTAVLLYLYSSSHRT